MEQVLQPPGMYIGARGVGRGWAQAVLILALVRIEEVGSRFLSNVVGGGVEGGLAVLFHF